jgi:hypothetical protein
MLRVVGAPPKFADADVLSAIRDSAQRFARLEVAPLVQSNGRDGDLSRLAALFDRAGAIGLLPTTAESAEDAACGIWGSEIPDAVSAGLLEDIAGECAGVAACFLHAALGAAELADAPSGVALPATVAIFNGAWRPTWKSLAAPPPEAVAIVDGRLTGSASFVHLPPGCASIVVYAAGPGGWERCAISVASEGLTTHEIGPRTGLTASRVVHLTLAGVPVTNWGRLGSSSPQEFVRRLLLGIAAIAVGNARKALRVAQTYAGERRQGGSKIADHVAVQRLLGDARSGIAMAAFQVEAAAACEGPEAVWLAAAAKLRVAEACRTIVSDCMQVMGGYGYMEDYPVEKCLRDAMALVATGIDPGTLRLMCAQDPFGTSVGHA